MRIGRGAWWWILVAFLAGLALMRGGRDQPVPMRDDSKVLLFAPNLNEAAFVLGYAGRIAAVTDYCIWPPALVELPRMGGILNPNLERIAAFDPGLLILQGENAILRNFAQREGIAVANVNMDGRLDSILEGILRLNEILAGPESPRGVAVVDSLRRRLDALRGAADDSTRPSVLLILGHEPGRLENLLVVGPGTYLQDLVRLVGGSPVPNDGPAYRNLSVEALVARPPDVASDLRPGAPSTDTDEAEFAEAWRGLGINGTRSEIVDFDGILIPGPRADQSAAVLRDVIFPPSRVRR